MAHISLNIGGGVFWLNLAQAEDGARNANSNPRSDGSNPSEMRSIRPSRI